MNELEKIRLEKTVSKTRNYPTNHVSHPNIGDVTNHEDGTCSFKINTIPLGGLRTVDVFQGKKHLFSISVSDEGVCYQVLQAGQDTSCFTLWEDEV